MIRFKSCPKCHTGDLEEMSDHDGDYLRCLQCGNHIQPQAALSDGVVCWSKLIEGAAEPMRLRAQDAFNAYMARAADKLASGANG